MTNHYNYDKDNYFNSIMIYYKEAYNVTLNPSKPLPLRERKKNKN